MKWLERIFLWAGRETNGVGMAALVIGISGVASRLLGLVRDRLLAGEYGAGDVLDAYYAAFRIPDFLYSLLVLGALSAAFVPVFTELIESKKEGEAWRLASNVFQGFLLVLGIFALGLFFFSESVVRLIAPGFESDKLSIAESMMRVMLLSPIFLSMSAVAGGVLVSFRQFIAYSLAPIFYNLGIIFGILLLAPTFGPNGLAWGVVVGALLHFLVQYPALRKSGFHYATRWFDFIRDEASRRVMKLMIPRSLSMGVNQVSLLVVTAFASALPSGSIAVFTLANNIQSVPLGLFGVSFALAAFPMLATFIAQKNDADFFATLARTARRILFFVVPVSILFIIFRAQFVRVILGVGLFDWEDTIATFEVLKYLSFSLFAQSLVPLFARAFFALQDTKTPLLVALLSEVVHLALLPIFLPIYGVEGLAMAFSVGTILNLLLLYLFLRKKVSLWDDAAFFHPGLKIVFASVVAGVAAQLSKYVFGFVNPTEDDLDTFIEVFTQLSIGVGTGIVVFVAIATLLRVEELEQVKRFVWCKVLRQEPGSIATAEANVEHGGNEA